MICIRVSRQTPPFASVPPDARPRAERQRRSMDERLENGSAAIRLARLYDAGSIGGFCEGRQASGLKPDRGTAPEFRSVPVGHDSHDCPISFSGLSYRSMRRKTFRFVQTLALLLASTLVELVPHDHRLAAGDSFDASSSQERTVQAGGCALQNGPQQGVHGARHFHQDRTINERPCVGCIRQLLTWTGASELRLSFTLPSGRYLSFSAQTASSSDLAVATSRGPPAA